MWILPGIPMTSGLTSSLQKKVSQQSSERGNLPGAIDAWGQALKYHVRHIGFGRRFFRCPIPQFSYVRLWNTLRQVAGIRPWNKCKHQCAGKSEQRTICRTCPIACLKKHGKSWSGQWAVYSVLKNNISKCKSERYTITLWWRYPCICR